MQKMQNKEAEKLRKAAGNNLCKHSDLAKEYYGGANTGDFVCTKCGKEFASKKDAEEDYKTQLQKVNCENG